MMTFNNAMQQQALSMPSLYVQQYEDLEPKTRKLLTTPEIFSLQEIIITGCGDSYAAGLATKHIFELLTGIPTRVVTAIELARLYDENQLGDSPNNPLVLAISNSGNVARMEEAVLRANKHGAFTVAITGDPSSKIGVGAQKVLQMEIPDFASSPGVRSYGVSVLALLLLAIRFGEVRGRYTMDEAMAYREDIKKQASLLEAAMPTIEQKINEVTVAWKDLEVFDFIGSGFDYAAAWYGHAKIFEATGDYAMRINTEEWLHLNFFAKQPEKIGTVLVCNTTNPTYSRSLEVIDYTQELGRPTLVVTDEEADKEDAMTIQVPTSDYQWTIILSQFIPLALLAANLSEIKNEKYGRDTAGPWSFSQDGMAVKESKIIIK